MISFKFLEYELISLTIQILSIRVLELKESIRIHSKKFMELWEKKKVYNWICDIISKAVPITN